MNNYSCHENCSENDEEDGARLHIAVIVTEVIFIILIALLTIVINALNVILLAKLPSFQNNMGMYLRSISCAGLITGITFTWCVYPAMADLTNYPYPQYLCEIQAFVLVQSSDVSVVTQAMLNLDRYVSIYYHMRYMQFMNARKCQLINLIIWFIAFLFAIPVFTSLGAKYMPSSHICSPDFNQSRLYLISLIVLVLTPATVIMFFSYIQLLRISRRHATAIESQINAISTIKKSKPSGKNMKALKMLLIITFAFNMTWLPFTGLSVYRNNFAKKPEPHFIGFFIPWWAQVGTLINAVIYFVLSKEYRLGLQRFLHINKKKNQEALETERTTAWM